MKAEFEEVVVKVSAAPAYRCGNRGADLLSCATPLDRRSVDCPGTSAGDRW
jgi:hypothetical protein